MSTSGWRKDHSSERRPYYRDDEPYAKSPRRHGPSHGDGGGHRSTSRFDARRDEQHSVHRREVSREARREVSRQHDTDTDKDTERRWRGRERSRERGGGRSFYDRGSTDWKYHVDTHERSGGKLHENQTTERQRSSTRKQHTITEKRSITLSSWEEQSWIRPQQSRELSWERQAIGTHQSSRVHRRELSLERRASPGQHQSSRAYEKELLLERRAIEPHHSIRERGKELSWERHSRSSRVHRRELSLERRATGPHHSSREHGKELSLERRAIEPDQSSREHRRERSETPLLVSKQEQPSIACQAQSSNRQQHEANLREHDTIRYESVTPEQPSIKERLLISCQELSSKRQPHEADMSLQAHSFDRTTFSGKVVLQTFKGAEKIFEDDTGLELREGTDEEDEEKLSYRGTFNLPLAGDNNSHRLGEMTPAFAETQLLEDYDPNCYGSAQQKMGKPIRITRGDHATGFAPMFEFDKDLNVSLEEEMDCGYYGESMVQDTQLIPVTETQVVSQYQSDTKLIPPSEKDTSSSHVSSDAKEMLGDVDLKRSRDIPMAQGGTKAASSSLLELPTLTTESRLPAIPFASEASEGSPLQICVGTIHAESIRIAAMQPITWHPKVKLDDLSSPSLPLKSVYRPELPSSEPEWMRDYGSNPEERRGVSGSGGFIILHDSKAFGHTEPPELGAVTPQTSISGSKSPFGTSYTPGSPSNGTTTRTLGSESRFSQINTGSPPRSSLGPRLPSPTSSANYLDSEEPGEEAKAQALDMVDKLVWLNTDAAPASPPRRYKKSFSRLPPATPTITNPAFQEFELEVTPEKKSPGSDLSLIKEIQARWKKKAEQSYLIPATRKGKEKGTPLLPEGERLSKLLSEDDFSKVCEPKRLSTKDGEAGLDKVTRKNSSVVVATTDGKGDQVANEKKRREHIRVPASRKRRKRPEAPVTQPTSKDAVLQLGNHASSEGTTRIMDIETEKNHGSNSRKRRSLNIMLRERGSKRTRPAVEEAPEDLNEDPEDQNEAHEDENDTYEDQSGAHEDDNEAHEDQNEVHDDMDVLSSPASSGADPTFTVPKRTLKNWRKTNIDNTDKDEGKAVVEAERNRRGTHTVVSVLFSHGLSEDTVKKQRKIVEKLGGKTTRKAADCTHFVAEKFVRTGNMLQAMAAGKYVVTFAWLENCLLANSFIEGRNFLLQDEKMERELGFSMRSTILAAQQKPLLQGIRVLLTPNISPKPQAIAAIVQAAGGQVVEEYEGPSSDAQTEDLCLVIANDDDLEICVSFLDQGAKVYRLELILSGITSHHLDFAKHELFKNYRGGRRRELTSKQT